MKTSFRAVEIAKGVHWVGAVDWGLRNFHGYRTTHGTSYNAYLVLGNKITLVDTVKRPFLDEMMARISSVVDPGRIDYVVSNHAEMDHSGCLPEVVAATSPEAVFASKQGESALDAHFHWQAPIRVVGPDETVRLGDRSFRFIETRMLHWPDSMFTYLADDGILFSNDAFGMHLASSERFADEITPSLLHQEAAKYYANILMPLSPLVAKLVGKLGDLALDVRLIAPDHGPIWRREPGSIVGLYAEWAVARPTRKALVLYDTMWQSTAAMARALGEGLAGGGASAVLLPLEGAHRSDVATELLDAGALVVGSPTMNGNLYPTVAEAMTYLKGLKRRNLVGAAFGSYGWSGEATGQLEALLRDMGVELVAEAQKVRYVPDPAALARCRELGMLTAKTMLKRIAEQPCKEEMQ